jgi:hypothetical protein
MKHWLADSDLVSVRDAKAIAALPEGEQGAWKQLWEETRQLQAAPK